MNRLEPVRQRGVKRHPPLPLTDAQVEQIAHEVRVYVGKMVNRRVPWRPDEMEQEAWVAALSAARNWKPERGAPLGHYVCRAIKCHVPRELTKLSAVVHLSKGAATNAQKLGPGIYTRADLAKAEARCARSYRANPFVDGAGTPAAVRDREEWESRWATRKRAYERACVRLPEPYRGISRVFIARVCLGMDGEDFAQVVEAQGLGTRADAAKAEALLRKALLEVQGAWDAANELVELLKGEAR